MVGPTRQFNLSMMYKTNALTAARQVGALTSASRQLNTAQKQVQSGMSSLIRATIGLGMVYKVWRGFTKAAIDDNFMLEKAIYAVGTTLNARLGDASSVKTLSKWIGYSRELMQGFENDASVSAARLEDFVNVAKTINAPVIKATGSANGLREMTNLTIAAATSLGVEYETAAVGIQLALAGAARNQNQMIRLLGIEAKTFNRLNPVQRYKTLQRELQKFRLANEQFKYTMVGAWTTFKDIVGITIRRGLQPFFETFKRGLIGINQVLQPLIPVLSKALTLFAGFALIKWGPMFAKAGFFQLREVLSIIKAMAGGQGLLSLAKGRLGKILGATRKTTATLPGRVLNRGTEDEIVTGSISRQVAKLGLRRGEITETPSGIFGRRSRPLQTRPAHVMGAMPLPGKAMFPTFTKLFTSLKGIFTGVTTSLSKLIPAIAIVAGAWAFLTGIFKGLGDVTTNILAPFAKFGELIWTIIKFVGSVIGGIFKFIAILGRLIGQVLGSSDILQTLGGWIGKLASLFDGLIDHLKLLMGWWKAVFSTIDYMLRNFSVSALVHKHGREAIASEMGLAFQRALDREISKAMGFEAITPKNVVNIDHIQINQNFKENVNPDNVAMSLERYLEKIAENPVAVAHSRR